MLSIIIPTLNEARFLPNLLADLARQIYRDFEVIIVDGRSDDETVVKARQFKNKIPFLRIITSQKRHVCSQRNQGAKAAKGKMLIFADADCRIGPEFMLGVRYRWEISRAEILSFWIKPDVLNPQNEAVAMAVNLFRELQNNLQPRYLLEALVAVDRKAFLSVGGFDEGVGYGEGGALIKALTEKGYDSKIFRDPLFTFSFRRLRQLGLLGMAGKMARLELSKLIGKEFQSVLAKKIYPMGGQEFVYNRKNKGQFLTKMRQLLEKMSGDI